MNLIKIASGICIIAVSVSCGKKKENKNLDCIPNGMKSIVIAYYPFPSGSLLDFSGDANHLTNIGGVISAPDRGGNLNCAMEFINLPTSSQFLLHNNPTFLNDLDEFTISLWYMALDTSRPGGLFETLVGRDSVGHAPDRSGQWSVGLYDCRRAVFGRTNSVWEIPYTNSCDDLVVSNTNVWKHAVATCHTSGEVSSIYINGELQSVLTGASGTYAAADFGDLFIGRNFTGVLDDIIIFKKALDADQVMELYQMEPCCP